MSKRKIKETRDVVEELATDIINKNKSQISDTTVTYSDLFKISKHTKSTLENNKNILEIFPDLGLAKEILVSSIISPNDMLTTNLNYKFNKLSLPSSVLVTITDAIKEHLNTNYDMVDKLYEIVEEALFTKGAYTELIIPDSFLIKNKKAIIAGLEHLADDLSKITKHTVLEKPLSLVKDGNEDLLIATDNISLILAEEEYREYLKQDIVSKINGFSVGYEEYAKVKSALEMEEVMTIEDYGNNTGIPLIKKLNVTSVIPVCDKNNPSEHYGYFVILDENGSPINGELELDLQNITSDKSIANRILSRAKKLLKSTDANAPQLSNITEIKKQLVINKLVAVLEKSKLNGIAKLSLEEREDIIDLIFDRLLKGKKTRILFVPESLLTYYAIEYKDNGVGKSMLEKILILASFRAILVFVTLLSYIKASIPVTEVNATLDENDPDYQKTMEKIMNEVLKNRQVSLPIGILKVDDLADWVHRVGFSFNFEHPGLPNVKVDIEEKSLDIKVPDSDFKEKIDKHIIMALGLTPEIIDNAYSPDFATSVVTNNILFNRRISKFQTLFNKTFTRNIKKYLMVDGMLRNKLYDLIKSNLRDIKSYIKKNKHKSNLDIEALTSMPDDMLVDIIYRLVIENITVSLPKPEMKDEDNLGELLDKYSDTLDKILDLLISEDSLPDDVVGDLSDKLDTIKKVIKTILVKRWMSENGYMDTVGDMFSIDEEGKPGLNILEEYKVYVESVEKSILPFIKYMKKKADKLDEQLDKIENQDEETNETEESNTSEESEEKTEETNEETTETEEESTEEENEESNEEESNSEEPEEEIPEEPNI